MILKKLIPATVLMSSVAFAIHELPKAELHLHLTGSYPLTYLKKITTEEQYLGIVENLRILSKGVPYHEAFKYFIPIEAAVNTHEKVERGIHALCDELSKDNVVYAEIRSGLKNFGDGFEEYLKTVLKGISHCPTNLKVKLLLSVRRHTPLAQVIETVDLAIRYKDQGIVGLDVSGDSTLGEIKNLSAEIKRAKENGLFLALHLGESSKETDSVEKQIDQQKLLEELQPERIGHGVFLSDQSRKWLFEHPGVPVEVCPSSSVIAGMIGHHSEHPAVQLYFRKHNHPIVIGTDDPLLFQTTLTNEYQKVLELDHVTLEEIKKMIRWSFEFSFLSTEEKEALKARYFPALK
ncbi:MAG: hypothetical protein HYX41_06770 [Bdellovibrio sp.]|nr:hypothetical protein [Bdellovibrio sp.]